MSVDRRQDKHRILVVEDEESIRSGLCDVLAYHGHEPIPAATGEEGLEKGLQRRCELVVLDVMLPGINGFDVCEQLRARHADLPILMLTAKGSEDDVVEGFRRGADDYLTKPFSVRELAVRVAALLRRAARPEEPAVTFSFGPWQVDAADLRARWRDEVVDLTPREVELLGLLAREAGRVVSRRLLLQEVWGMHNVEEIETRTVDVHIAKLRKKIDRCGRSLIETVRGAGYRPTLDGGDG